jgi:hypothetical protein
VKIPAPIRSVVIFLAGCLVAFSWLPAGEPGATLKARPGPPVLQELMGGCSLTCSFPWDARTGGGQSSVLTALNDSDAGTAWTAARSGDRLVFQFPKDLPRELNGTPVYGIDVANGSPGNFADFGRVKTLRLSHNGKPLYLIHLADSRRWQKVEFDDVYLNVGDTLSLEIVDIYPGKESPGAALTEIVLQGAH